MSIATVAEKSQLVIEPVSGFTGAEIGGVDLSSVPHASVYAQIRAALNKYGVIFFRDQELTPAQYVEFGGRFGTVSVSKSMPTVPGHPLVNLLVRTPEQKTVVGEVWHTDQAYRDKPTFGTILYGKEVPAFGGDTAFINMAKAYEDLSEGLKKTLDSLSAVHLHALNQRSRGSVQAEIDKRPEQAVHPVVVAHPETGRKSLFISPGYASHFDGWSVEESAPLLNYLFQHAQKPEYGCRFRWKAGSIAFWDNRQVWHYAVNDYFGVRRVMHRLVVG